MRAAAQQISSGCMSLRTKSLTPKDPAAFFLIYIRITSTALKKFVSQMYSEEYKQQICAYAIFCVLMFTPLI